MKNESVRVDGILAGLRYLFIVQGEGRGHMTQAIVLKHLIEKAGGTVVHALVGKSRHREIPDYFSGEFAGIATPFEAINFVPRAGHRSVGLTSTVFLSFVNLPAYVRSIKTINRVVADCKPDVIVNFYEVLGGLARVFRRSIPVVCIAHQYSFLHPDFKFPAGHAGKIFWLKFFTRMTALNATKQIALSFYPMPEVRTPRLVVVPPLLKEKVRKATSAAEDFILVYLLNYGYGEDLISWHKSHPGVRVWCFWDKPDAPEEWRLGENLVFHRINEEKFVERLCRCKGLISTAGFESVAEALYLKKPVCVVPVSGHIEQLFNAFDIHEHGIGLAEDRFDFDRFTQYIDGTKEHSLFREWMTRYGDEIIQHLQTL